MKFNKKISLKSLVFSKWSRKNYAIFASLKKVVKIARLSVDICASSLKKNASSIIVILNNIAEEIKPEEDELELELLTIESPAFRAALLCNFNSESLDKSTYNTYFLTKACAASYCSTGFFNLKPL